MLRSVILIPCFLLFSLLCRAQDAGTLMAAVRAKLEKVNDYRAQAELKTRVSFIKVPDAAVEVLYKKPNQLRIRNDKGISLVPKESSSLNLYSLLTGKYQVIDGGSDSSRPKKRIIKLLPEEENGQLVLATLYIDPAAALVTRARITNRENGTDEVDLEYGKYAAQGLPSHIVFTFNTRNYVMPKGVTFDYDDGNKEKKKPADASKTDRGRIEMTFTKYEVNVALSDSMFR